MPLKTAAEHMRPGGAVALPLVRAEPCGHAAGARRRRVVPLFFTNPLNPLSHTPVGRHASAACEVFERTTRRYLKPAVRSSTTTFAARGRRRGGGGDGSARSAGFSTSSAISLPTNASAIRASCSLRPCRAISRRCCAGPSRRCCPTTRSTSPTGTTPRTVPLERRHLRSRRLHHLRARHAARPSAATCTSSRLPARGARARRHRAHGGGQRPGRCRAP